MAIALEMSIPGAGATAVPRFGASLVIMVAGRGAIWYKARLFFSIQFKG